MQLTCNRPICNQTAANRLVEATTGDAFSPGNPDVDQQPGHRRTWDPIDQCDILGNQIRRPMDHVRTARNARVRGDNLDGPGSLPQIPKMSGGCMRCDGSLPRPEHRHSNGPLPGGRRSRDQVDGRHRPLPKPSFNQAADLGTCQAGLERRSPGHCSVMASRFGSGTNESVLLHGSLISAQRMEFNPLVPGRVQLSAQIRCREHSLSQIWRRKINSDRGAPNLPPDVRGAPNLGSGRICETRLEQADQAGQERCHLFPRHRERR